MKTRQILVCAVFGAILVLFAAVLLLRPAQLVSEEERRPLARFQTYAGWKPTGRAGARNIPGAGGRWSWCIRKNAEPIPWR